MWYFARICVCARSWREFAKCRFTHFPSFFSVHVDTYAFNSVKSYPVVLFATSSPFVSQLCDFKIYPVVLFGMVWYGMVWYGMFIVQSSKISIVIFVKGLTGFLVNLTQ